MAAAEVRLMRKRSWWGDKLDQQPESQQPRYVQYPNEQTGTLVIGNQTFYGVISIDGEFACAKCKVVNPDMEQIGQIEGKEMFRCACGNQIMVEMPQYGGKAGTIRNG